MGEKQSRELRVIYDDEGRKKNFSLYFDKFFSVAFRIFLRLYRLMYLFFISLIYYNLAGRQNKIIIKRDVCTTFFLFLLLFCRKKITSPKFSFFEIDEDLFAEEIVNFHPYTRHQSVVWTFPYPSFFGFLIKMLNFI